ALAVGFFVLAIALLLTGSAQTAVLGGAAAATLVWVGGQLRHMREAPRA
ncbi:MAG: hypothetical protein ICV72_07365, partial [Aldersonia sp.]|nr:hypothetical protein [Aldersonia sp.]